MHSELNVKTSSIVPRLLTEPSAYALEDDVVALSVLGPDTVIPDLSYLIYEGKIRRDLKVSGFVRLKIAAHF